MVSKLRKVLSRVYGNHWTEKITFKVVAKRTGKQIRLFPHLRNVGVAIRVYAELLQACCRLL